MPLISAQTLNSAITPLLSALQTVETVFVKGYREKAKDTITKLDLQDLIAKSVGTANSYQAQIASLEKQYKDTISTFNDLVAQRAKASNALQVAGEKFQQEIISKLRVDTFFDGLQAILSIASAAAPNVLQIGDIYSVLPQKYCMPMITVFPCVTPAHSPLISEQELQRCLTSLKFFVPG